MNPKIPFFTLERQNKLISNEIKDTINNVIDSLTYVSGPEVSKFEESFAEYCGAKYCVALNSGTAALHLALLIENCSNENVITTPNSFIATSSAISMVWGNHIFSDTKESDGNLDIEKVLEYELGKGDWTLPCYLPVSLYGNPCDLQLLQKDLIIHDACQAVGAKINNRPIAEFAKITCYSFYVTKNLGTFGEAGAIITDDKLVYDLARSLRNHGRSEKWAYEHQYIGYNYRMSEISAAILNVKLKYLEEWTENRISLANRYLNNLKGASKIKTIEVKPENRAVWHLFPVFIENRGQVRDSLNLLGIGNGTHYPISIHKQYCYPEFNDLSFPIAEKQSSTVLTLPMFPELTIEEVDIICDSLLKIV